MQILRVVPYSATQLYSYEVLKKRFQNEKGELSISSRLAAGGLAGMVATLVSCLCNMLLGICLLQMPIGSCTWLMHMAHAHGSCTWLILQVMSGHTCCILCISCPFSMICKVQTSCTCVLVHMLHAQPSSSSSMLAAYFHATRGRAKGQGMKERKDKTTPLDVGYREA